MEQSVLTVEDLVVEFPTRRGVLRALDHVSFTIGKGEVLGMVGESGAGKSLTGAAVIGLLEPPGRIASGRILLGSERIDQCSAAELRRVRGRRIGTIFQDPLTSLNPLYTVAEQLIETIRTHLPVSRKEARERAVALLDSVGIPAAARRLDDYPHHFSGGMRQRVVIALALAAEPELVIADEPTTALDVSVQAQIIDLLQRLCSERGLSVLLITHDMGVIAELAHRVAVLYAGTLVEIGPVGPVLSHPTHPYTDGLIRSIPDLHQRVERLTQIPGAMPALSAIPAGCPFHPRCLRAQARCAEERPQLERLGPDHAVACWVAAAEREDRDG